MSALFEHASAHETLNHIAIEAASVADVARRRTVPRRGALDAVDHGRPLLPGRAGGHERPDSGQVAQLGRGALTGAAVSPTPRE